MASMLAEKKRVPWLTKTGQHQETSGRESINNGTTAAAASGDADCGVSFCYQIQTLRAPRINLPGLDNPGGKASKYWADRGWKYRYRVEKEHVIATSSS